MLVYNHSAEFCPLRDWTLKNSILIKQLPWFVCIVCFFVVVVDCWLSENLMYLLSLVNGLTGDLPFLMTYFT